MRDTTDSLAHLLHGFDSGCFDMDPHDRRVYRSRAEVVLAWASEHKHEIPSPSTEDE